MALFLISYCGLLVCGAHVEKYKVMSITIWFMPAGWGPHAVNETAC
jgi:hypothetical protein